MDCARCDTACTPNLMSLASRRARVDTDVPNCSGRLSWRHRARPSATLHEIQARSFGANLNNHLIPQAGTGCKWRMGSIQRQGLQESGVGLLQLSLSKQLTPRHGIHGIGRILHRLAGLARPIHRSPMTSIAAPVVPATLGIRPPAYELPSVGPCGRVRLAVSSLERSLAFYNELLGLTVLVSHRTVRRVGRRQTKYCWNWTSNRGCVRWAGRNASVCITRRSCSPRSGTLRS